MTLTPLLLQELTLKVNLRNAKPCPVCTMALKEAGIHNVHYTTDDGFVYRYQEENLYTNTSRQLIKRHTRAYRGV